jgi:hypothetical protein
LARDEEPDRPRLEIVKHGGIERPPAQPEPPLSPEADAFRQLYPPMLCALCNQGVADIQQHLEEEHSPEELASYQLPEEERKWNPRVNDREAAAHPGGREGALIEKSILASEREGYRQDILGLIRAGHQPGFLVAQVAYHQLVVRRFRLRFEREARKTGGDMTTYDSKSLAIIDDLTERISKMLVELEKVRKSRLEESAENPMAIVEAELSAAERFLIEHQGEFSESCPSCQMPLLVPGLPHWAFAPLETAGGTEWMAWSTELFELVQAELAPLWQMAYVLRVSPEGLQYTAARRGLAFREDIDWAEQEALVREVLRADDAMPLPQALQQRAVRH